MFLSEKRFFHMFKKRSRLISAKARELLFADENYITLILTVIIFAVALILPLIAYYIAYGSVNENYLILAFLSMEIFLAFPLLFGIVRIAGLASKKADVELMDVFYAFGSVKKYFKVIFLGFIQAFKHLTPISLGCILAHLVIYIFKIRSDLSIGVIIVFALTVYALFLPLISKLYAVNLLTMADDVGVIKAIKLSWGYTRENVRFLIVFSTKMIPILIISIAAICVPLVIYTMPFLFCAYAVNCRKLIQTQKQNDISPVDISAGEEEINEQDS